MWLFSSSEEKTGNQSPHHKWEWGGDVRESSTGDVELAKQLMYKWEFAQQERQTEWGKQYPASQRSQGLECVLNRSGEAGLGWAPSAMVQMWGEK